MSTSLKAPGEPGEHPPMRSVGPTEPVPCALQRMTEVPVHACMAKPFDLDDLVRLVGVYAHPNGHV